MAGVPKYGRGEVGAGEICVIPAGTLHGMAPGSHGTLLIFDA